MEPRWRDGGGGGVTGGSGAAAWEGVNTGKKKDGERKTLHGKTVDYS